MTFDIVLAGVGGQGVLSLSSIIAAGALEEGLFVKQSEVHGMAQRGGTVTAHLRLSNRPIASDLVPIGAASMVLSLEPLEGLRFVPYLAPDGRVIAASEPVVNIPDYPPIEAVLDAIRSLRRAVLVDAADLARRAGLARATNMVMAGAAAPWLPLRPESIEQRICAQFERKGAAVVTQNLAAFRAGQETSACTATR
jgi:indolepyruvate ferredoxin oxidoreductase beta subunit